MGDAVNDDLHGLNGFQFRCCEKRVNFIHLRKEFANGVIEMCLFNNYLQTVLDCVTTEA